MAISKDKKKQLLQEYAGKLSGANSVVVVQQSAVQVNNMNAIRKELHAVGVELSIVRKRLFMRAAREAGLQDVDLGDLTGSVAVLYADANEMSALKTVSKFAKQFKKEDSWALAFLGAWMQKDWKDGVYVTELANVPSKEELLSKFVYLLNYPVQSFAATLKEVAQKKSA